MARRSLAFHAEHRGGSLGNMALYYSVSSSATNPAIRYAARLATDSANTLGQGEAVLIQGAGHQTDSDGRWGDYSSLSIDPADGSTFWMTNEYYATSGQPVGRLVLAPSLSPPEARHRRPLQRRRRHPLPPRRRLLALPVGFAPALGAAACQNFDSLAGNCTSSTTPSGWSFAETGTNADTTYTAGLDQARAAIPIASARASSWIAPSELCAVAASCRPSVRPIPIIPAPPSPRFSLVIPANSGG